MPNNRPFVSVVDTPAIDIGGYLLYMKDLDYDICRRVYDSYFEKYHPNNSVHQAKFLIFLDILREHEYANLIPCGTACAASTCTPEYDHVSFDVIGRFMISTERYMITNGMMTTDLMRKWYASIGKGNDIVLAAKNCPEDVLIEIYKLVDDKTLIGPGHHYGSQHTLEKLAVHPNTPEWMKLEIFSKLGTKLGG